MFHTINTTGAARRDLNMNRFLNSLLGGLCAGLLCFTGAAHAQAVAYPTKPIRIIVPNPAGGSADLMPRLISEALSTKLGQPVTVDNRAGAAGNIGAEFVYNSPPDGYTLLAAPPPPLTVNLNLYPKLNYDSTKFQPVTVLASIPNVLMLHPDVPLKSVEELIAFAKANPDKLTYASQGSGSTAHLTAELFKLNAKVGLTHVPYKGDAPALTDLLAGRVDMMFGNIGAFGQHVRSGKLKVIAVTSRERLAVLPGIPAMREIVPGVVAEAWFGMVAPPGTPKEIAQKLSSAIAEIMRNPDIAKRYADLNATTVGNNPEQMAAFMSEDRERWARVIKAGKIGVD
jgi:tripartite-type tricarboxylate transporter receptor subunit TctC